MNDLLNGWDEDGEPMTALPKLIAEKDAEIEGLTATCMANDVLIEQQAKRIAELEGEREHWYCENCGCGRCLDAEDAQALNGVDSNEKS